MIRPSAEKCHAGNIFCPLFIPHTFIHPLVSSLIHCLVAYVLLTMKIWVYLFVCF